MDEFASVFDGANFSLIMPYMSAIAHNATCYFHNDSAASVNWIKSSTSTSRSTINSACRPSAL